MLERYPIVNIARAINFLITALIALFFIIFLPFVLMAMRIDGPVVFILIVSAFLASFYFYNRIRDKRTRAQILPIYEKWKKDLFEMGFNKTDHGIIGRYRNHNIKIEENLIEEDYEGNARV